jgi:hypothetical protein
VTLTLDHGKQVVYKFVLDGQTWVVDPANPDQVTDGYGGYNSIKTVDCGTPCGSADAGMATDSGVVSPDSGGGPTTFDWRDAVMYFALLDRFAEWRPGQRPARENTGVEPAANFHGGDLAGLAGNKVNAELLRRPRRQRDCGSRRRWTRPTASTPASTATTTPATTGTGRPSSAKVEQPAGRPGVAQAGDQRRRTRAGIRIVMDYVMNHVHSSRARPMRRTTRAGSMPLDFFGKSCVCGQGCSWDDPGREHCAAGSCPTCPTSTSPSRRRGPSRWTTR